MTPPENAANVRPEGGSPNNGGADVRTTLVQTWPRRDDITPHSLVEAVAEALAGDHADCDPESCCQRNSGPDWVEAHKALAAVNAAGYRIVEVPDGT